MQELINNNKYQTEQQEIEFESQKSILTKEYSSDIENLNRKNTMLERKMIEVSDC